jgi:hypothetical protein
MAGRICRLFFTNVKRAIAVPSPSGGGSEGEFAESISRFEPRTIAADVRRRKVLQSKRVRLVTSAATNGRFMVRVNVLIA